MPQRAAVLRYDQLGCAFEQEDAIEGLAKVLVRC